MTKFEEEAMKELAKSEYVYTAYDGTFREGAEGTVMEFAKGNTIYTFPWIEFAKNWHSDEEFQELLDKYSNLNDNYEKEVIRSSKIESQIIDLKSQLQQQALPVVPEDVDKAIKYLKKHNNSTLSDLDDILTNKGFKWLDDFQFKDRRFGVGGLNNKLFILSHLAVTGYTVEKPQLFRLKLKNATISNYYLWLNHATGKVFVDKKYLDWTNHNNVKNTFKEQEIAKISDGAFVNNEAFELVPVEDGE